MELKKYIYILYKEKKYIYIYFVKNIYNECEGFVKYLYFFDQVYICI